MKQSRPKIRPPRKFLDRVLEAVAIGGVLFGVYIVLLGWSGLPATIPTHFDASGNADDWGPKYMIWLLPAISVVMVPAMLFLRRFPWLSNMPIKITEVNAENQYSLIVRLLSMLACFISLLFLALVHDTITIAEGGTSLLGAWFIPVFIIPIFGSLFWYFVSAMRACNSDKIDDL
jgi:uncharacterized membrane protein